MRHSERGSAFGYFLAALLGAILGGLLVVAITGKTRAPVETAAPPVPVKQTAAAIPAPTGTESVADAVKRVGPAVVSIRTSVVRKRPDMPDVFRDFFGDQGSPMPQQGEGSGVIIDARRGYVLTNSHVVKDTREITVTLPDKRHFTGKVVGQDEQSDLAVVRVSGSNLPQASLSPAGPPPIGSWVIAIGNPYGFESTVTAGVVSATERDITPETGRTLQRLIQTDAAINPGNSGGPLCNLKGEVIGINTAIFAPAQGIGFAISSAHARTIADQLIEQGKVVRPYIGIYFGPNTPEFRDYFELPTADGVIVSDVVAGSPAAKAGLQRGDCIVEIDRVPIKATEELQKEIQKRKVGAEVSLLIYRGRDSRIAKLRTVEKPQNLPSPAEMQRQRP